MGFIKDDVEVGERYEGWDNRVAISFLMVLGR